MNSKDIVSHFKAAGFSVRVRDFGDKFRICPRRDSDAFPLDAIGHVADTAGLTSVTGRGCRAGFNGSRELNAYKPGSIVRFSRS